MSSNDSLERITNNHSSTHCWKWETQISLFSQHKTFWFRIRPFVLSFSPINLKGSLFFFFLRSFLNKHFCSKDFFKFLVLSVKGIYFSDWDKWFLVMCTRLYAPLSRSVGRSQVLALFVFQVKRERILIFFSLSAFWDLRVESEISQNGWLIRRSIRCSEGP